MRWTGLSVWVDLACGLLLGTSVQAEPAVPSPTVLVEAEGFEKLGGWVVDQQFMDEMGSPFLLAHGLGVPVDDAITHVEFPAAGTYRVWVRTRDWVAPWKAPGAPGRFQVIVDGRPLEKVFGTEGADWRWQDGGTVAVARRGVRVALHDLTGFEGRCDALLFTSDPGLVPPDRDPAMAAFRRKVLGLPERPEEAGSFDLVVVGGGMAGTCAALSAARLGLKVALVQDRPVLGGNNSSEVRVWLQGARNVKPYPRLGDVVRELEQKRCAHYGPRNTADLYEDDKKLALVRDEPNIRLFLGHRVNAVETDGARLVAVVAQDIITSRRIRLIGRWFADCTGDGGVGFMAKAHFEMTRSGHMGQSNLWNVIDTGKPASFPRCPWALDLSDKPFPGRDKTNPDTHKLGVWYWESGFDHDPIARGEYIRDWNFRAMYGAWDALKNVDKVLPNHRLNWAAYVSGKRESRRLLGDVVLTKEDLVTGKVYPDGCVPTGWKIDLHLPDRRYEKGFEGDAFISEAEFGDYKMPYWIPYRCLYSRNVPNLFMAGRDISVTHEALGAVRVMRTGGVMGEVVGMAASLCKKHNCDARAVYQQHLDELKQLMSRGVGKLPPPVLKLNPPTFLEKVGSNLACSARVNVSGSRDMAKNPPHGINDGRIELADNDSRWVSDKRLPHVVEFLWEQPRTVGAARIVSGFRDEDDEIVAPIRDFSFQYRDGTGWKEIGDTKTTGNRSIDWHAMFPPVTTDRIRLVVTAAPDNVSRIWEIELYAPSGGW